MQVGIGTVILTDRIRQLVRTVSTVLNNYQRRTKRHFIPGAQWTGKHRFRLPRGTDKQEYDSKNKQGLRYWHLTQGTLILQIKSVLVCVMPNPAVEVCVIFSGQPDFRLKWTLLSSIRSIGKVMEIFPDCFLSTGLGFLLVGNRGWVVCNQAFKHFKGIRRKFLNIHVDISKLRKDIAKWIFQRWLLE